MMLSTPCPRRLADGTLHRGAGVREIPGFDRVDGGVDRARALLGRLTTHSTPRRARRSW
jgi:hypothetical protein